MSPRPLFWVLDERGEPMPIPRDGATEFDQSAAVARGLAHPLRQVKRTWVRNWTAKVSTVFLGADVAFSGPPILWETAVFIGTHCETVEHCGGSREQAEAMHAKWVRLGGLRSRKRLSRGRPSPACRGHHHITTKLFL